MSTLPELQIQPFYEESHLNNLICSRCFKIASWLAGRTLGPGRAVAMGVTPVAGATLDEIIENEGDNGATFANAKGRCSTEAPCCRA